jgi:hypothetical protein
MIPMHFFGGSSLNRFLARSQDLWPVERRATSTITIAKSALPARPTIIVLPGN